MGGATSSTTSTWHCRSTTISRAKSAEAPPESRSSGSANCPPYEPRDQGLDEFHDRAKDLLRRDIHDAGKPLPAFLGIVIDVAPGARDPAADDVASVLMTPFVPVLPGEEEVDDICAAQGCEMARAGIIADENRAERQQGIEVIERQPLVQQLEAITGGKLGGQPVPHERIVGHHDDLEVGLIKDH